MLYHKLTGSPRQAHINVKNLENQSVRSWKSLLCKKKNQKKLHMYKKCSEIGTPKYNGSGPINTL